LCNLVPGGAEMLPAPATPAQLTVRP